MLRVYNETAKFCDQGGGRRKGSFAIYLEPWHPDIFEFLKLRNNQGVEELRCRDLFTGLWIPDLFMQCVHEDKEWHLICPDSAPDLIDLYGDAFNERYKVICSNSKNIRKTVKARQIWEAIIAAQTETGTPYLCYKDAFNNKSNQKNVGTIRSSNLCCEIAEYSSSTETAVCNLASIVLPKFVIKNEVGELTFDYDKLEIHVPIITRLLDRIIDINYYPHQNAKRSNLKHRPIGIGIQGLADVFMIMGIPFASLIAIDIGSKIMETIYFTSLKTSIELAKEHGHYITFKGSPASMGILQFDMWGKTQMVYKTGRYGDAKWKQLKCDIQRYGLRNSLLVAPMPTASTSQICGTLCESFEPLRASVFTRRTIAGEFAVINPYLVRDLEKIGKWNTDIRNLLICDRGSVKRINGLTKKQKDCYKTAWEMSQKWLIDHAASRGKFVCQSQSLNLYATEDMFSRAKITPMHFYAWRTGLKTGCYYLRTNPSDPTIQFTVDTKAADNLVERECISCGS